ncbi:MAG: malate synthase A [Acidobacteria bacterium]|nr:malate synthase A [Acidobacteriota bacterium]
MVLASTGTERQSLPDDLVTDVLPGVALAGAIEPSWEAVLTTEAIGFVARLARRLDDRRLELLSRRDEIKSRLDLGWKPGFLDETRAIRESEWSVAPIPADIRDRRVEITGPVDRKMIINALNSGANVFMADFEDANAPTLANVVEGQLNLRDAVRREIEFVAPESGKRYSLANETAVLFVRPRGWHLDERHLIVDGRPVSASLFDFGLFFFHNAKELIARGTGPYFYLPKIESHLEARLWNEVFVAAQDELGIPSGTIRATVLIETILAAFEMDEILWELREHSAGLNCGRWDYIFSFIKKFRARPDAVMPDRALVTMTSRFLDSYSKLLVATCHRRGIHAMGGMAAQIPIKGNEEANLAAMEKVRADKLREVTNGHDGTWVAHPALVPVARSVFDDRMPQPNQIDRVPVVTITADDLLAVPDGPITERGVRQNVNVGILYLEAWLRGNGCVPLYDLMEDAATAEISRTQLWQWIRHGARLDDGRVVTPELYLRIRDEEVRAIRERIGELEWRKGSVARAAELFDELTLAPDLADFLTHPAYDEILADEFFNYFERRIG